jgi:hypothetical protein
MIPMHRLFLMLFVALLGVVTADVLHAQDVTVRGRVIGPDAAALGGQRVVLHRVDAAGGATIAEAVSAADGAFELSATVPADTGAVYFVAARYDEELYIGPPFRPSEQGATEQMIQVGVPAMSATTMMAEGQEPLMPARRRPAESRSWMLLIIPLLGVAGVAAYALIPRNQIPRERALLLRVAELDERMMTAPAAQKDSLLDERRELIAQLRAG